MSKKLQNPPSKQMVKVVPTAYEPKMSNQFIVDFDGIDNFVVKKIEIPPLKPSSNGKLSSRLPVKLFTHCPVSPSVENQIETTISKQDQLGLDDCVIKFINRSGIVIYKWVFTKPQIVKVMFSPLDYNVSGLVECEIHFMFSSISFEY